MAKLLVTILQLIRTAIIKLKAVYVIPSPFFNTIDEVNLFKVYKNKIKKRNDN